VLRSATEEEEEEAKVTELLKELQESKSREERSAVLICSYGVVTLTP
jgi:hypothetical protein